MAVLKYRKDFLELLRYHQGLPPKSEIWFMGSPIRPLLLYTAQDLDAKRELVLSACVQ